MVTASATTQIDQFAAALEASADAGAARFAVVSADATGSFRLTGLRDRHPERVIDVGIAEANAVAMAYGISRTGVKVFVVGFASFLLTRGYEALRSYVAYHRADVTLLGGMTGLSASYDGFMHQPIEDVGLARSVPVEILIPSDEAVTRMVADCCLSEPGPRYVRLVRRAVSLPPGEAANADGALVWRVRSGDDVLLCASGAVLEQTVGAAERLVAAGAGSSVLEIARVAPSPAAELRAIAAPFGRIVVVEDHVTSTGLATAVREALSEPAERVRAIGVTIDELGSGAYEDVMAAAGLASTTIAERALA